MLSIIIFTILILLTYALNLVLFINTLGFWYITIAMILSIVLELIINAIVATVTAKILPKKWFEKDCKFFDVSKKEQNFYVKVFKVKLWKDNILELGALNGFRKNAFNDSKDPEYIKRFIVENNIGYADHLFSIILGAFLIFAYPSQIFFSMGLPAILINFIMNYMPVVILRYNTPRLKSALKFAERSAKKKEENPEETETIPAKEPENLPLDNSAENEVSSEPNLETTQQIDK